MKSMEYDTNTNCMKNIPKNSTNSSRSSCLSATFYLSLSDSVESNNKSKQIEARSTFSIKTQKGKKINKQIRRAAKHLLDFIANSKKAFISMFPLFTQ